MMHVLPMKEIKENYESLEKNDMYYVGVGTSWFPGQVRTHSSAE